MQMIKTTRGLPNSCSQCGKPIKEGYWYAANEDAAFAGQGICEKDVQRKKAESEGAKGESTKGESTKGEDSKGEDSKSDSAKDKE